MIREILEDIVSNFDAISYLDVNYDNKEITVNGTIKENRTLEYDGYNIKINPLNGSDGKKYLMDIIPSLYKYAYAFTFVSEDHWAVRYTPADVELMCEVNLWRDGYFESERDERRRTSSPYMIIAYLFNRISEPITSMDLYADGNKVILTGPMFDDKKEIITIDTVDVEVKYERDEDDYGDIKGYRKEIEAVIAEHNASWIVVDTESIIVVKGSNPLCEYTLAEASELLLEQTYGIRG